MAIVKTFTVGAQATKLIGTNIVRAEVLIDLEATPVSGSDVIEALKIPAGAKVMEVHAVVKTAEGGGLTLNIGDGSGTDSWDAAVNANAAAGTAYRSTPGTDAYATSGKFYATADTIDVIPSANADAAQIVVMAVYMISEKYA